MASIVENIIGDRALQLGSEEFVRKLSFGNNWNFLRIAARVQINGMADIAAPRLQLGLCNGDQATFTSANCNYVGATLNVDNNSRFRFASDLYFGGVPAITQGALAVKKIVNTTSEQIMGTTVAGYIAAASLGNPSLYFVDVFRVSASSYTVYFNRCTISQVTNAAANLTSTYAFLRCAEDELLTSTFAASYITSYTAAIANVTLTGLSANMDTVSIYWNKSTPTVEISDLSVIRFY
jgi:hypothetical protein